VYEILDEWREALVGRLRRTMGLATPRAIEARSGD
jgi:hypothetical protein